MFDRTGRDQPTNAHRGLRLRNEGKLAGGIRSCAVIVMQILPFSDDGVNCVVEHFERAPYANPAETVSSGGRSN
ncbi:MAG TPA: hypothetical protein VFE61_08985 [Candidatus Sulfotelmatobacter sp.]|nr:hypothetical protein [Candidatus Sulfotelmatobacter sp.]